MWRWRESPASAIQATWPPKWALTLSKRLEAGTVWTNTYRSVSYMAPFGGYKRSGIGRESGMEMIKEYLQTKCVWIDMGNDVPNPFVLR